VAKKPQQRSLRVLIGGQLWAIAYKPMKRRNLCGLCDYESRTISICTSLEHLVELDTLLHELLHAAQGFASEDHVAEVATTLATILWWQLGYRKEADDGR
jgi:hypothetical protein